MRVDEEMRALFIEAYQAKLAWAKIHSEMHFAWNRAFRRDVDYYTSIDREYYDILHNRKEPAQKKIYEDAKLKLLAQAEHFGLNQDEVQKAFTDAVNKAAETYQAFVKLILTGGDDWTKLTDSDDWAELYRQYENVRFDPNVPSVEDDKAALEIMKNSLPIYIQARTANQDNFFSRFDRFFGGHDRETKLRAAKRLHDYDPSSSEKLILSEAEYSALNQGNLYVAAKEKLSLIKGNIEILPNYKVKSHKCEYEEIPDTDDESLQPNG